MLDRHKSSFLFVKSLFNFSMQFFHLNSRSVFLLQFFEIKGLTIWQWKKVFFIVLLLFIVHYVISVRNQKNVLFVFRHKKTQKRNQQQQQHTKQQKKWIRRTMFCRVFFFILLSSFDELLCQCSCIELVAVKCLVFGLWFYKWTMFILSVTWQLKYLVTKNLFNLLLELFSLHSICVYSYSDYISHSI